MELQLVNLTKEFGNFRAVNNLNLTISNGVYGLLGVNGAGKTTLMKMLYGKTKKNQKEGVSIRVFGFDPEEKELEIKFLSGIVPQEDNLDLELSVIQNLMIYAKFYGIKTQEAQKKIDQLLNFMELSGKKDEKIRNLSGGMKRRLIIVRALINNPQLLILDEPTTGLDPQVRHIIWDKLRFLKNNGVAILLTTHYMEEAYQLCDHIIMMNKGQKVLEGIPAELIQSHIETYVLELLDKKDLDSLKFKSEIRIDQTENRTFLFSNTIETLNQITHFLKPGNFYLHQSNLEDLFLKITGRGLNE